MIKKIIITNFDGSFGSFESHWEEKMTITKDKVKYEIVRHYRDKLICENASSCILENGKEVYPNRYRKVKSGWEYKLNLQDDYPFDKKYYYRIFEMIKRGIEGFNPFVYERALDAGETSIDAFDEDGNVYTYSTISSIDKYEPLYKLLNDLIPTGVMRPYFLAGSEEDQDDIEIY